MKKTYIAPTSKVYAVQAQSILDGSINRAQGSEEVLGKGNYDDDDDWEW